MKGSRFYGVVFVAVVFSVLGAWAATAEDKYALKVPDGLAFSEFRGYETWEVVSLSQTDELLNVIVANPTMIQAYKAGIPGNGKPFPDGAKSVKIQWKPKKSTEAPFNANIPDTLKDVALMAKDAKRFADGGGWGYAVFNYDPATDRFAPEGTGASCGVACHTIVKSKDYVFTAYGKK